MLDNDGAEHVVVVDDDPTSDDGMPVIQLEIANQLPPDIEAHAAVIMAASKAEEQQQQQQPSMHEEEQQAILVPRAVMARTSSSSSNSPENVLPVDEEEVIVGGIEETLREIQESEIRAEFISVMLPRPPPSLAVAPKKIGIQFVDDNDSPAGVVESMEEDSVLADLSAVILPGDQLVSINGKPTILAKNNQRRTNQQLLTQMQDALVKEGLILIFQNTQENARGNVVASVVTKPTSTGKLGITVGAFPGGRIQITDIATDYGIIFQSLLNVGDTIMMVNGVPCINSTTTHVVDVLRGSPKYIYIVAQTGSKNAVTIGECTTPWLLSPTIKVPWHY